MPLGESFLSTIRSNKSIMLDKSKRFRKTEGSYDWSKSGEFDFPRATPEQLKEIREQIQKDQKRTTKMRILAFLIIIVTIFFLYLFVFK